MLLHLGLQHHPPYQSYQVNNDSRREEINTGNADVLNLVLRSAMWSPRTQNCFIF